MRCRYLVALLLAVSSLGTTSTQAQSYGLTSRPTVGPYFDGVLPTQPPAVGTNWSTVVAFPNLRFQNALGILPMPGTNKLVVWEREGRIYHFENNAATAAKTLIVDFSTVCQGWDDSGLLGIAFHPQFDLTGATGNRYLFTWYNHTRPAASVIGNAGTRPNMTTDTINRLSRWTLDANGVAVPGSELVLIEQYDSSVWHNGGGMFFHPMNGFLYITNGDDGDEAANAQRIDTSLFSGVLRIDVDKRGGAISHPPTKRAANENSPNWPQYYIPNDNPFVGVPNALEEFFAIGLRSPHRMTIDPPTGRIFIGDVGYATREEITIIEPSDPPGLNLQWNRIEGYNGDLVAPYIGVNKRPAIDYVHGADGNAVIGGYVYRGTAFPELVGKYIFADNGTGKIWYLDESTYTPTTPATKVLLAVLPNGPGQVSGTNYAGLSSFGLDANNELLICQMGNSPTGVTGGQIYKLQRGGPAPTTPLPALLSATGVFSNLANLTPSTKLIPYGLNQPFWSDNAVKSRWAVVPSSGQVGFTATGEWSWPEGTVLVKHFELPADDNNPAVRKRLETRLLVKNATGVYGATYKWRADNSDADLLDNALTENVPIAITPVPTLTSADIGSPLAGSTTRTGDDVTMTAAGADIWGTSDQFRFAYQTKTGDFDISVRVESLTQTDLYAKAGFMARESLTADSRHVMALVFPSNAARGNNNGGYEWQSRETTGGNSTALYPATPQPMVNYPNTWLRFQRSGNTFIGYSSADGVWWTEYMRQTVALPSTVYLGLAVTSHNAGTLTTAKFHLQSSRYQPWYYPSRTDCITCHNNNAGGILGPKTRQLNGNLLYPNGVTDNQLRSWAHIGLFSNPPAEADLPNLDALAPQGDTNASLEKRARSYLDSNCASCHRPGGVQALWDARYDTPLASQGILYGRLVNHLGNPATCVVVPQDLSRSVLYHRASVIGPNQMPPLAKNQVDTAGVSLLAQWINSMSPNVPPVVALTSPAGGAAFNEGDSISLTATASDIDGIQRVEFYDGDVKIGEDTTAPYSISWTGAGTGQHLLFALAIDGVGNTNASSPSSITIRSTPIPYWTLSDIGNVTLAGSATYTPATGTYTLKVTGGDFWGTNDGDTFLNRQISGNFSITARVVSMDVTDTWSKAGVMVRESLAATSRAAFANVTTGNGSHYDYRTSTSGSVVSLDGPIVTAPYWVRIVRATNSYSAYVSPDGLAWTLVSTRTLSMGTVYVGLALSGRDDGNSVVKFDNVTLVTQTPSVQLTAPVANTSLYSPASVNLAATATPGTSAVSRVDFYVDGVLVGTDSSAPYTSSWNAPTYGTHVFTAQVVDTAGLIGYSSQVAVTMNFSNLPGWRGEYFNRMDLTNPVLTRLDSTINFNWGTGSPDSRIGNETFSIRWSGRVRPLYSELYTLSTETDDGVRLWVNGQLLIDYWIGQAGTRRSGTINLVANQEYDVVMEYFENGTDALARLYWSSASQAEQIIPASRVTVPTVTNTAPFVWLSNPLAGDTYLGTDLIPLIANPSDSDGTISKVEFWADGAKLGELTAAPYLWNWPGPRTAGAHLLSAVAFDNNGATAASAPVTVQIQQLALQPTNMQPTTGPGGEPGVTYTLQTTIPAGRNYVIEWSANLTDWNTLQSGTSTGAPIEVIDATIGVGQRFYRLRITN